MIKFFFLAIDSRCDKTYHCIMVLYTYYGIFSVKFYSILTFIRSAKS